MGRIEGTVKFFDPRKGFGMLSYTGADKDLYVHRSAVVDQPEYDLAMGENVTFEIGMNAEGIAAANVRRTKRRYTGTVIQYSVRQGWGLIEHEEHPDETVFVHQSNIAMGGLRKLEEGAHVEFSMREKSDGGWEAVAVLPDTRPPLERFAYLPSFDEHLEDLAGQAQDEPWEYKHTPSKNPLPVLRNYIMYTFRRLKAENKIAFATDSIRGDRKLASFNTGLVTPFYEPIYAVFAENPRSATHQPFVLQGFFPESAPQMGNFARRPELADYFAEPADLIYDRRRELRVRVNHIVEERSERFPAHYHDDPGRLAGALELAIRRAEARVLRNYKTAIPQYSNGDIQLLLPLALDSPTKADVALVVGRQGEVYMGYTVLTLDMAYNNARLLARPDDEWLVP